MKYRKKPIVIDAMQLTDENKNQVLNWITCTAFPGWNENGKKIIKIQTLEGDMIANMGDYIIRGVNGEFYPCKSDIFDKTYEKVI